MRHSRFLAIPVALAAVASAQAVVIAGTTKGYFDGGIASNSATLAGLTFTTGTFMATSNPTTGFFAIGDSTTGNFGTFNLDGNPFDYTGHTFGLEVTFTNPAGVNPSTPTYTALLIGQVVASAGGVAILFNTAPQNFTFPGGAFSLTILPVAVNPNNATVPITGYGTASAVPGPGALTSFGIGALGLLRRKRRA